MVVYFGIRVDGHEFVIYSVKYLRRWTPLIKNCVEIRIK